MEEKRAHFILRSELFFNVLCMWNFISSRSCDQLLDHISDSKSLYEFALLREPIERLFSISHGFLSRFRKIIIDVYSSRSGVI
jgi:hypothetical protein